MKVIAIDFDGVLNNLVEAWVSYLNRKYLLDINSTDVKEYDMSVTFPMLTYDEIYEPLYNPYFWYFVKPINEAAECICKLQKNNKVVIVTNSDYRILTHKFNDCLFKHYNIVPDDVIITSHKDLIRCDYIIDDYEENLKNCSGIRILINHSYNTNADVSKYDWRAKDIIEATDYIMQDIYWKE